MIFTDYIKEYFSEDSSILSREEYKFFDKQVFNDDGKTLDFIFKNPVNETLFFKKGFIVYTVNEVDIDGYNNDKVCYIYILYKTKDSKMDWKKLVLEFWRFLKLNGCTKVLMHTKLKPDFWIENYGFRLKRYEMERDI